MNKDKSYALSNLFELCTMADTWLSEKMGEKESQNDQECEPEEHVAHILKTSNDD